MRLAHQVERRASGAGLAGDLDVLLRLEQGAETGPDQQLVVRQRDPDHDARPETGDEDARPDGMRASTTRPPPSAARPSTPPPSSSARSRIPSIPLPVEPPSARSPATPAPGPPGLSS